MKAILTDNATKAVFATLDIDNSSLNATNGGAQNYSQVSLHLTGTQTAPLPSAAATYDLSVEDDLGNVLEDYPSVTFSNYSRVASESGTPPVITMQSNMLNFKINE